MCSCLKPTALKDDIPKGVFFDFVTLLRTVTERFIHDKFPGLRGDLFNPGCSIGMISSVILDRDLSKFSFIDRINLHFKLESCPCAFH